MLVVLVHGGIWTFHGGEQVNFGSSMSETLGSTQIYSSYNVPLPLTSSTEIRDQKGCTFTSRLSVANMLLPSITAHILGANGDEMLAANVAVVVQEQKKCRLACLRGNTGLRVGRKPGIKTGTGDEDVPGLLGDGGPRLIASAEFVVGGTLVVRVTLEDSNDILERSGWLWCWLVVRRLRLQQAGEDVDALW